MSARQQRDHAWTQRRTENLLHVHDGRVGPQPGMDGIMVVGNLLMVTVAAVAIGLAVRL